MTVVQLIGHDGSNVSEANWESVFGGLFEGVFSGVANQCQVIASSPAAMTVEVRTGTLVSGGVFGQVTAQHLLTITAADPANPRIDRVVARRTNSTDTFELAVLAGTPAGSPTAPALTRAAGVYEISLAQVLVGAAVVQINTADITDERFDRSVCGFASGLGNSQRIEILDRDVSQQDVANTLVETSVYSFTIPAGALGATGGIRLSLSGDLLKNVAGNLTLRIKLGTPSVFAEIITFTSGGNRRSWAIVVQFLNVSASSQKWGIPSAVFSRDDAGDLIIGTADIFHGTGINASSEDTAAPVTVEVTAEWSVASVNLSFRKEMALLELLPA